MTTYNNNNKTLKLREFVVLLIGCKPALVKAPWLLQQEVRCCRHSCWCGCWWPACRCLTDTIPVTQKWFKWGEESKIIYFDKKGVESWKTQNRIGWELNWKLLFSSEEQESKSRDQNLILSTSRMKKSFNEMLFIDFISKKIEERLKSVYSSL